MPVEESSTGYEDENKGFKIKRGCDYVWKKAISVEESSPKKFINYLIPRKHIQTDTNN